MNESQARKLADAYTAMGYVTSAEQTGGNIWVVTVFAANGTITEFGIDSVQKIHGPLLADWPMTITLA